MADLGNVAEKSGGGFNALKEIGIGALRELGAAALNLAGTALAAVGGAIKDGIADAQQNAIIQAQTAAVLKSTGNAAGKTAEQIADYASSLSDAAGTSLFGDDQIQQSTNLLLTFSEIKGATLDAATAISVDMAQAMGGAPKDAAIQLGKALNDPMKGITALTRVGVVFTEEQKAQIQAMQEAGDMAGAQEVILAELNKEFGGSAKAAADATGGWSEFNGRMGEAKEALGAAVLPLLTTLAGVLLDVVMPAVEELAAGFAPFMAKVTDTVQMVMEAFGENGLAGAINTLIYNVFGLESSLGGVVEGALASLQDAFTSISQAAIPALLAAWAFIQPALLIVGDFIVSTLIPMIGQLVVWFQTQIPTAIAILTTYWNTTLLPIFNALVALWTTSLQPALSALMNWLSVAIPVAIAFLVGVWNTVLQPTIAFLAQFIATVLIPAIGLLVDWLAVNIPIAVQVATDFFNTVLLPAIQTVWAFIQDNVLPLFAVLWTWLSVTLPNGLQVLANFWNTVLLPAINAVWSFITTYVIPLFTALVNLHIAVLGVALRTLTAIWSTVLLPALQTVWGFIQTQLGPIINWLTVMVLKPLMQILSDIFFTVIGSVWPALSKLASLVKDEVTKAFNNLNSMAGAAAGGLSKIGEAVSGVIRWINDLIAKLNSVSIPDWLEGHSPPPMADWLNAIAGAGAALNAQLPELAMNLSAAMPNTGGGNTSNVSNARSFTYAPQYSGGGAMEGPMDMALASSLAGV